MPYKNPTPIAKLIKDTLHTIPYHNQRITSKIMRAFTLALPFIEGKIQRLYLKKSILYVKLDSALLAHELRLNKTTIITRIKDAYKQLGEHIVLQKIVFL